MNALRFLFDPRGRVSRRAIWLGLLLPYLVVSLFDFRLFGVHSQGIVTALFAWPLYVAVPWKRMHDMGRAGWWNAFFWGWYVLGGWFFLRELAVLGDGWLALFAGTPVEARAEQLSASGLGGFSTILIFATIQFGWLYLIPGQRGPNAYGPDPLATSEE